jgi:hypothetical protein
MEIYLSRAEIRNLVRATLGQVVTEALGTLTRNKLDANINAAALKASGDCTWISKQKRATIDITTAQYKVIWPADCSVGGFIEASLWDPVNERYYPLNKAPLPTQLDLDQIAAIGGDDFLAVQGMPRWVDPRQDFIWLYPANDDTARKITIAYNINTYFTDEDTKSAVDGQLIMMWTMALMNRDDEGERQIWQGQYADRLVMLRRQSNTGKGVPIDPMMSGKRDWREYPPGVLGNVPNWDMRPRTP